MSLENTLKIEGMELSKPIIQGGMGVGISMSGLAAAVAEQGGAGTIASVGLGPLKGYFDIEVEKRKDEIGKLQGKERRALVNQIYMETNRVALIEEIKKAKAKTNGFLNVNIMHVLTDFPTLVRATASEGVGSITVGAGIPSKFPGYLEHLDEKERKKIKLFLMTGSLRFAKSMTEKWWKRYNRKPDAIIVEGPKAGGHLAYEYEDLVNGTAPSLEKTCKELIDYFKGEIPIIGAGGIYSGEQIYNLQKLGVAGVQIATILAATKEGDASDAWKQEYINCEEKDIIIIESPVGMPGRAISNDFLTSAHEEGHKFTCLYDCIRRCKPLDSIYCIGEGLVNAQQGHLEKGFEIINEKRVPKAKGFVFIGAEGYRVKEILPVKTVIDGLEK